MTLAAYECRHCGHMNHTELVVANRSRFSFAKSSAVRFGAAMLFGASLVLVAPSPAKADDPEWLVTLVTAPDPYAELESLDYSTLIHELLGGDATLTGADASYEPFTLFGQQAKAICGINGGSASMCGRVGAFGDFLSILFHLG